jgi:hypothetical protein
MKTIDLHTHSNFSDGTCSPEEIVALAIKKGLSAFALTDHDTVAGIPHALAECKRKKTALQVIPGTELSTEYHGHDIHIVGLFIDYQNQKLADTMTLFVKRRASRNAEMVKNLQNAGIPITLEAMKRDNPDTVITRAHFAKFLVSHHIVETPNEAFSVYLGKDTPYYVPRAMMTSTDAVHLILQAGGIPILAHPMHYKLEEAVLREMITELQAAGLVGIEVKYSNHSPKDDAFVAGLAREYQLLPSGGSDFHGTNKPAIDLGSGRGSLAVPYEYLEQLAAYAGYPLR